MPEEPEQPVIAYGVLTSHNPAEPVEPPEPPVEFPPANRDVPYAYQAADKLITTMGNWNFMEIEPHSYAYQWRRDGIDVPGALSDTLTITAVQIGYSFDCVVSATNTMGSAAVASNVVPVAAF